MIDTFGEVKDATGSYMQLSDVSFQKFKISDLKFCLESRPLFSLPVHENHDGEFWVHSQARASCCLVRCPTMDFVANRLIATSQQEK